MKNKIFIISFFVWLVDIISKRLVVSFINEFDNISIIKNFFSLTYVKNTGVAFSFLDGYVSVIILMTLIVLFIIFKYLKDININRLEAFGYSFIIGGAIGNLFDRVVYGYVIDFLDFKIFGYNYPVFNLADTFIVIGVFMLILFGRNGEENEVSCR